MITNEQGKALHLRAVRGDVLTSEERTLLDEWYANQDQQESALLSRSAESDSLAALRQQVDAAVAELVAVTQHIQSQSAENEAARREVAALREQVVRQRARSV